MDEIPLPPQPPSQSPMQTPVSTPAVPVMEPTTFGPQICPQCHFPVKPEYYFCPNCGAKLTEAPLGTGVMDQLLLYGFSIVLPIIFYLAITKWQGIKYMRSVDPRAKQIGYIALALLIISSIIFFWWSIVQLQGYVQQSISDVNNLGTGTSF